MKITALLLLISVSTFGQDLTIAFSESAQVITRDHDSYIAIRGVQDSLGWTHFKPSKETVYIHGDTLTSIIGILKYLDQFRETNARELEALRYAEEILSCLRTDGYVTDWKKFRKAVKDYMSVKDYHAVIQRNVDAPATPSRVYNNHYGRPAIKTLKP